MGVQLAVLSIAHLATSRLYFLIVFHHDILCQKEIHSHKTIHQLWSLLVQSLDDLVGQISFVNQETLPGSLCLVTSGLPRVIASTDNRWISVTNI